jgi:methylenetetrahydrofolate dehydrogenase (NADP+) / methenyltetrahydrofolate cyclohydrolase
MSATVIDGDKLAEELRARVTGELHIARASGARPGLATLLVGDDYASMAYDRRLRRLADRLDCPFTSERLPADVELADVQATIGKLNADPRITGILILRPMPRHVPEVELYRMLDPAKDIEAVHPANAGLLAQGRPRFIPSTPASCFYLLDAHVKSMGQNPKTWYDGKTVVLVGRSHNVGKPALWLGLERNATVVSAHKATADAGKLAGFCQQADVLIVAAGVPGVVTGEMVSDGVIAVDVGINAVLNPETGKNKMVGDIDFASVAARASAITPVPGGVGPITDVWLLRNTIAAAIRAHTSLPMEPWVAP